MWARETRTPQRGSGGAQRCHRGEAGGYPDPALEAGVCRGVGGAWGGPQAGPAWLHRVLVVVVVPHHPPSHAALVCLQPKLTPQEKLKLRMQKALNRQCKQRPRPPLPPAPFLAPSHPPLIFEQLKPIKRRHRKKCCNRSTRDR